MSSPEVNFEALAGILRQLSDCLKALDARLLTLKTKPPPPAAKAPSTSPSTPVASKPPYKEREGQGPYRSRYQDASSSVYPLHHPIQSHPRENDHHPVYHG